LDKCPKTAGVATNKGCPELTAKELAMFPNINFDLGKTYIKAKYRTLLNKVVQAMKANPEYQLIIKGHCDIVGTEERNKEVSLGRAENVAKYLIEKGVEADRLTTQSFSYDKPIADNTTAKGRAKNRRVEFEVTFK
jgi:outer membrane protein OmpA-like peptidoglycan-associated protein